MSTESDEVDSVCFFIKPYKKQIPFYMALHVAFVISCERMWIIFRRNFFSCPEYFEYFFQGCNLFFLVFVTFKVFLKLSRNF